MNVDDYRENETHTVTSKYFTKNNDMDDSLACFKESKKIFVGPKSTKTSKSKPKKPPKKVKGQKDIRKVLKSNKNDIVKYAEEFENVCKKSGIDVDADQLQLAIALSKSLQSENETVPTNLKLTIKERKNKIRTTLEEYGFKVPEIKIANKKVKKHRKEYKLLSKTDIEKQQILSDRYSQVLLKNLIVSKNSSTRSTSHLYNVATNVVYDILKDNSIYYVDDLIERSNTSGCLFKDYADIPGRPISPELFEKSKMNFSELECSQDELDIVLSGTIKNAKNVLNSKQNSLCSNVSSINDNKEKICEEVMSNDSGNVGTVNQKCFKDKYRDGLRYEGETKNINSIIEIVTINETKQYRSHSPDIFDDEVSSILEDDIRITRTSNNVSHFNVCNEKFDEHICNKTNVKTSPFKNNVLSSNINTIDKGLPDNVKKCLPLSQTSETTNRKSNDFMDLTECIQADDALCTKYTKLSQSNQTKRTSNDFMEITECVGIVADHIDLTQNKNEEKETAVNIDLTQSSNSNESFDDLPIICLSKSNSLDATVILNENEHKEPNIKIFNNTVFDLSDDKVDKEENNIFDDFIHKHSSSESENQCKDENVEQIDLSQDSNDSIVENDAQNKLTPKIGEVSFIKTPTNFNEIFDTDYVRSKSVSPIQSNISNQNIHKFMTHNGTVHQSFKYSNILKDKIESNDIDLTQSSDSVDGDSDDKSKSEVNNKNVAPKYIVDTVSKEIDIELTQVPHEADQSGSPEYSVLGKKDNISIDYDELNQTSFTENVCVSHNDMEIDAVGNQSVIDKNIENNEENHSVFEIIDNELNYSLGKYRFENFELGGLSIINDLSKAKRYTLENEKHNITTCNDLPKVDLVKEHMSNETPKNMYSKIIRTPGNSEYIIKTDDVTPMLNYATMASPERNAELEKYGIKPLKRKRAIQLLDHLYNQTHPIVESIEDLPTPSKRLCNSLSHIKSPKSDLTTKTWDDYESSSDRRSKIRTNIFGNLTPIEDSPNKITNSPKKLESPQKEAKSPRKQSKSPRKLSKSPKVVNSEFNQENLHEIPCIKNIEYEDDELVFQKREKAKKIHSCRVPLHIAFHNYVSSKNGLREAILRYEPVDIEVIHKDLVAYGHRYDPKDLLRFMDKKCITVKYTVKYTQ